MVLLSVKHCSLASYYVVYSVISASGEVNIIKAFKSSYVAVPIDIA